MTSQLPPNPNVSTFNNSYWINQDDPLSQAEADKLYLKFPISQSQPETFLGKAVFNQGLDLNNSNITNGNTITANSFVGNASTATSIYGGNNGDLLYQSGASTTAKLPIGSNSYILTSNGSAPVWTAPVVPTTPNLANVLIAGNNAGANGINMNSNAISNASSVSATTFIGALNGNANTATNISGGVGGSIPYQSNTNVTALLPNGTAGQVLTSAGGTNAPSWTNPAPTSTLSQVLSAGNNAGSNGIDMNTQSITNATAITATTFNGALNGNANTASTATNALACSGNSNTATTASTATNALACSGNSNTATTATNVAGGANGSLVYQTGPSTTTTLPIGTNNYILKSNGTIPIWDVAPATPNLAAVLAAGNSAGMNNIDMNSQYIINATAITATTFNGALNGTATQANAVKNYDITFSVNDYTVAFGTGGAYSSMSYSAYMLYSPSTNTIKKSSAPGAPNIIWDGNATTATTATNANNSNVTNSASGTRQYLIMTTNSSGNIPLKTSTAGAIYNATTNTTDMNTDGNALTATTATNANNVNISNTASGATNYVLLSTGISGNQQVKTDTSGLSYDSTTNLLTANITGNSVTATTASKVALTADNNSGTFYIPFAKALSTSEALYVDNATGPLTYNPSTSTLTATTFSGALTGTATTATTATKVAVTNDNTSGTYYIPFTKSTSSSETLYVDNATGPLTYNPSTSTLTATTFTGSLNGNATTATSATNQADGVAIPAMYFFYDYVDGAQSSESGTHTFTALPDTNYMVFSSFYYGYSGSSGTYNATNSSSAINTVIIYGITTTQFSWVFTRSTGDNLAVYIVFQLIRSPSLNFAKSY